MIAERILTVVAVVVLAIRSLTLQTAIDRLIERVRKLEGGEE